MGKYIFSIEADEVKDMTGLQLYDSAITEPAAEQSGGME